MDIVVSRESIKLKAQSEYRRGFRLEDCTLPVMSEAAKTWREEWRRLDAERRAKAAA